MDISEEPQRKVFKARKTMKASDRQQLEAIHKAKEELLKPAELKLINGNHENGDLDMNFVHNTDSLGDRNDLHDVINAKYENTPLVIENVSDLKEHLRNVDLVSDLKQPAETNSDSIPCQDASKAETSGDALLVRSICSDPQLDDSAFETNDQRVCDGLSVLESLSSDADLSEHCQSNTPVEGKCLCVENELNHNLNLVENVKERKLECEPKVSCLKIPNNTEEIEQELHNLDTLDNVENQDCLDKNYQKKVAEKDISSDEIQTTEEAQESVKQEENVESVDEQKTDLMSDTDVVEPNTSLRENEESETSNTQAEHDVGDVATSSSMEVDQPLETVEQSSSLIEDLSSDKTAFDVQPGTAVANVNSMETDEIIPILEKLAPVEDVLQCFPKSPLCSESVADDERADSIAGTPSKVVSESLPSEAFLVLSDEEETCENITKESSSNDDQGTKEAPEIEEQQKQDSACDAFVEDKSEIFHRKRSKSEDLDSQISKRRRFEREEYEAELKVKITAGDDVNEKLQKVIQRMFEEKLSALQCADFDKAISELKMRVEKIECKKHENILHSIQAKITRLTKRFGTAKEDLKRRPEQSTATQPASPGKPAVTDLTAVSSSNSNSAIYRNGSTVRQMLESKRNVGEGTTAHLQTLTSAQSVPNPANLTVRASNATQISSSQPPTNVTIQTRAPPDWKLIQQKINAQNTSSTLQKSNTPVTSTPAIPSVLSAATTATVVGNSQVSTSTSQPMSVSLQSLPVILHVPLAVPSQSQILQGTTGTLVTNQQSGNVEFIPVQNQSSVSNLTKTPVTLPVTKAINSPSVPSASIQRNSPASSVTSTLTVQAISASHPITLSSRPSVPNVGSSSIYNQTSNRSTAQLKSPVSGYSSSSEPPSGSRADLQNSRVPAAEITTSKRPTDSNAQGGKPSAGVIDLTLDDEDPELSSHDRRTNPMALSASVQQSQTVGRQSQPVQMNNLQTPANVAVSSQATIHVLPTAQTTVNVTQRPGNPTATRAPAPRAPNAPHMVYTTTTMPTTPVQTPIRNAVVQGQNLRQMTPQAGGVPVRMQQTTSYVVNNGISMGSGPQLTVHHRPPQETAKPIHPAPLPEAPQPQRLPPEATSTSPPQKPHLKLARVQSQNGIVLSWSVLEVDRSCAAVDSYHLYAYHEDPSATSPSQWKKIGEVKALPLPMACTLTQFVSGSKYYFAVRAKDLYGRFGPFCDPQSTDVIATQSS